MTILVPAIAAKDNLIHVRLAFIADDWRIDEISVANEWRRPVTRTIPPAAVSMPDAKQNASAITALRDPDESYVITSPGQSFSVTFHVGQSSNAANRTWFVASQGYYTEWVRGTWIKNATGKPFTPSNAALVDAIHAWQMKQTEMEKQFYTFRIATR
jgi:hypothetical protein